MSDVPGEPLKPAPTNPGEPESVVTPPFGAPRQTEPHSPFLQTPEPPMRSPEPTPTSTSESASPIVTSTPEATIPPTVGLSARDAAERYGIDTGYSKNPPGIFPSPIPETTPERAPDEPFIPDFTPAPTPELIPAPEVAPTPEPESVNLTDINPNWRTPVPPEVHDAVQNAQAAGYKPSLEDTQPISLEAIRKVAAAQGIDIPTPPNPVPTEPTTTQPPVEPAPASTPFMTTVEQPVQTPAPDPMAQYQDTMANLGGMSDFVGNVPPVDAAELARTSQPQTAAPTKRPGFLSRLFGGGK